MTCRRLLFIAPRQLAVVEEPIALPKAGEVLVQSQLSAISPGTELLVYRGELPADLPVDETLTGLQAPFSYPLSYGYASLGRVVEVGAGVEKGRLGERVFCFSPHASHTVVAAAEPVPVPEGVSAEDAVLLASMETATSLMMDAQPMIGERVVVFGQGIVGLLATQLLSTLDLGCLIVLDRYPLRREWASRLGADHTLDPDDPKTPTRLGELLEVGAFPGADLSLELSGNPAALDAAIGVTGFGGRVVVGSWYGSRRADLDLGGRFHRSHMRILSSQVSQLSPQWSGRWNKGRRLELTWSLLGRHQPSQMVTHRFSLAEASRAYRLLDRSPESAVQVLLVYGDEG